MIKNHHQNKSRRASNRLIVARNRSKQRYHVDSESDIDSDSDDIDIAKSRRKSREINVHYILQFILQLQIIMNKLILKMERNKRLK